LESVIHKSYENSVQILQRKVSKRRNFQANYQEQQFTSSHDNGVIVQVIQYLTPHNSPTSEGNSSSRSEEIPCTL